MAQKPSEEQVQTSKINSPSTENPSSSGSLASRRNSVSLAAVILFASFFIPWATFFGSNISGLDIQKTFSSYKLVWLLPACALLTFLLNIARLPTAIVRRLTGAVPLGILIYSLSKFGNDFWQMIAWGGWLALAAGAVLIVIPNTPKPQPKV
jgi:hypothetical protein